MSSSDTPSATRGRPAPANQPLADLFYRLVVDLDEAAVNLERVFNDPRDFDLVLWAQGTDALPYLEEGEKSDKETWRQFQRVFRGDFLGFAAWVN